MCGPPFDKMAASTWRADQQRKGVIAMFMRAHEIGSTHNENT